VPDPKRRSPASRPGRSGDSNRGRPSAASPAWRPPRAIEAKATPEAARDDDADRIKRSIQASAEMQSDQRFGSAARRVAILFAVICVLTLTIAGPVRTYFAQRTEMHQLAASEAKLRNQITQLEQQKVQLGDPAFIAAQARERLGFVMPGEVPYQVQLPPNDNEGGPPPAPSAAPPSEGPWYSVLWHTIADQPHGIAPPAPTPVAPEPTPPPAPGAPPAGG
jgi:cell division protein FtsB